MNEFPGLGPGRSRHLHVRGASLILVQLLRLSTIQYPSPRPGYPTFVDEGKITLDLFTCDISLEDKKLKNIIGDYFGVSFLNIDMYFFTRG